MGVTSGWSLTGEDSVLGGRGGVAPVFVTLPARDLVLPPLDLLSEPDCFLSTIAQSQSEGGEVQAAVSWFLC